MSTRTALDIPVTSWKQYRPIRSAAADAELVSAITTEARMVASTLAAQLKIRFGASKVMLFGSLARGDFHAGSDIDLAVWGVPPVDYFRAVAFASGFSVVFTVDLIDAEDCSESLLQHIQGGGVEL